MRLRQLCHSRSLQNISLFGVALILQKGAALLMLPIMAYYLSTTQLGTLELLASIGTFSALLVSLSLHEVLYRFAAPCKLMSEKKQVVNQVYSLTAIIALTFFLLAFAIVQNIVWHGELNTTTLSLLFACISLECLIAIGTAWLRIQDDKAKALVTITVSALVLQLSCVLLVLNYWPSVTGLLLCSLLSALYQCVALHWLNRYRIASISSAQLKRWLRYAAPLMFSALLAFTLNGAERWFIGGFSSLAQLGIYAIAAKFALALCILVQPFGMWWMPKRFECLAHSGEAKAVKISQCGLVYISLLAVAVFAIAKVFVLYALPTTFASAITFLALLIPAAMFKESYEIVNLGLLYRHQTRQLLILNLVCALLAVSLFWGLSSFGVVGVCFALAITQGVRAIGVMVLSQQAFTLPWQFSRLAMIFLCALIGVCALYFASHWLTGALSILLCFGVIIALAWPILHFQFTPRDPSQQGLQTAPSLNAHEEAL
ncbi:oligosaccharide translocase SypK [Vibrio vulnificus]|uniref:lipopolysaccharide biosynthesis protein n=1 Tax=Vibrio vulnificus TaxID=672 RepID=UPI000C9E5508|nr:oligosaccharide flippase family protein [Vibrio vulnificus]PNG64837.1 oligosaccharide translocase SypK [Vibrio vulnificus]POC05081.1 oligosaccharide translocase SypK [Vibrio vulnificus]POC77091.1 oligosaccharide translocase SypK [Vibrio vulnificus]